MFSTRTKHCQFPLRRLARILQLDSATAASPASSPCRSAFLGSPDYSRPRLHPLEKAHRFGCLVFSRRFCSRPFDLVDGHSQGPATINYHSLLQEDEFHRLADSTIHGLQEKLEEYGDNVQIDGFDVDYGNDVLTVKLGDHGTYVLNKQTPNRQLWLSSPVSGPSRFDWDQHGQCWFYRRNKTNLLRILETELEQLCGESIILS